MKKKITWILAGVVILGFTLRLVGITYGLPLWLVGDEPPFVLGALKMIDLKTILPVLHTNEFAPVLYFSPYLSYVYLLPFIVILGKAYLSFHGSVAAFSLLLLADLSHFFIVARIISAIVGTATILLLFRVGKNIFKNETTALLGAVFLAFSPTHVLLSHWGRDWIMATFFFTLLLLCLTEEKIDLGKRLFLAGLIGGIAFGVSIIAAFIPVFIIFWALIAEGVPPSTLLVNKYLYAGAIAFVLLAGFSILIYPSGFFLTHAHSITLHKSFPDFFGTSWSFLSPTLFSEPFLIILAIIGLIAGCIKKEKFTLVALVFIASYFIIFYLLFHFDDRFIIYLFPLLALLAANGVTALWRMSPRFQRVIAMLAGIATLAMLVTSFQVDRLLLRNDTRSEARAWIESHIRPGEKIMVLAPLTRLSHTAASITEQKKIDPHSLRKVDIAERTLDPSLIASPEFHALNLYTVDQSASVFFESIGQYIIGHHYRYALVSDNSFSPDEGKNDAAKIMKARGILLQKFIGSPAPSFEITEGAIGSLKNLFTAARNGPSIGIYQLTP